MLDALGRELGARARVREIPALRFRRAVRPGDELELRLSGPGPDRGVRFELLCDGALVSDGRLVIQADA